MRFLKAIENAYFTDPRANAPGKGGNMEKLNAQGMTEGRRVDRREFLGSLAAALFAGVVVTMTGCGTDDDSGAPAGSVSGNIDANHGHGVSITKAQLDSSAAATLTLSTAQGHSHQVALTAEQVVAIAAGTSVTTDSTSGGDPAHIHTVTFAHIHTATFKKT